MRLFLRHCTHIIAIAFLSLSTPVHAAEGIVGLSVTAEGNGSEIIQFLSSHGITPTKKFTLVNPHRVVLDIPTLPASGITLPGNYQGTLISAIRYGKFDPRTARLVIDTKVPVQIVTAQAVATGLQVRIAPLVAGVAAPTAAVAASSPFAALEAPVAPTVAEVRKPLIVIDAGHGGQDPGALGGHKTREKEITLKMAKALKNGLLRSGRYRVALTREDDRYILLPERVNIARRLKGDVFISLHADSNPRKDARGLSIYTLSETASDDEAAALAEQENKSDIIGGLDLNVADEDVASILIDLTQRETMNKSTTLADVIVDQLHPKVTKLPSTHRYAGFRVLKAPDIPSVLMELGFLSNATDERLLQSREYEDLIVASLIKGLDRFTAEGK